MALRFAVFCSLWGNKMDLVSGPSGFIIIALPPRVTTLLTVNHVLKRLDGSQSLWPSESKTAAFDAEKRSQTFATVLEASSSNLLADSFPALAQHLMAHKGGRVDIVVDNAGQYPPAALTGVPL